MIILAVVGCVIGYLVVGGIVYGVVGRIEESRGGFDEYQPFPPAGACGVLWPLIVPIWAVFLVVYGLIITGGKIGPAIVNAILPRPTAPVPELPTIEMPDSLEEEFLLMENESLGT